MLYSTKICIYYVSTVLMIDFQISNFLMQAFHDHIISLTTNQSIEQLASFMHTCDESGSRKSAPQAKQNIPVSILGRNDNIMTCCPCNEDRERARNEISTYVQSHLASVIPTLPINQCDGSSGWTHIAYLNMTHPALSCPSPWTEFTSGNKTVCFRSSSSAAGASCDSVIYNNPQ